MRTASSGNSENEQQRSKTGNTQTQRSSTSGSHLLDTGRGVRTKKPVARLRRTSSLPEVQEFQRNEQASSARPCNQGDRNFAVAATVGQGRGARVGPLSSTRKLLPPPSAHASPRTTSNEQDQGGRPHATAVTEEQSTCSASEVAIEDDVHGTDGFKRSLRPRLSRTSPRSLSPPLATPFISPSRLP